MPDDNTLQQVNALVQFVNGTEAIWNDVDVPVPAGVLVYAYDTTVVKMGDGTTLYSDLPELFKLSDIINIMTLLAAKAPLDSPIFSGIPKVPTATAGTSSNQAASTAFVTNGIAAILSVIQQTVGTVLVNGADDAPGFMLDKIIPGSGISIAEAIVAGVSKIQIGLDTNDFLHAGNNLTDIADAALARTALQLSPVANTGNYADLTGTPSFTNGSGINITFNNGVYTIATALALGALAAKSSIATTDITDGAVTIAKCNAEVVSYDMPFNAGFDASMNGSDLSVRTYSEQVVARTTLVVGARGKLLTPSSGAAVIVDILKNGSTIYTTKPQFAAGSQTLTDGVLIANTKFAPDDQLTFKVTQVGSGTKGQKLMFTLKQQLST